MAKTKRKTQTRSKKTTRSVARKSVDSGSLLFADAKSQWGKDQPMVLTLAAGIIIFIVVALYFSGWL